MGGGIRKKLGKLAIIWKLSGVGKIEIKVDIENFQKKVRIIKTYIHKCFNWRAVFILDCLKGEIIEVIQRESEKNLINKNLKFMA